MAINPSVAYAGQVDTSDLTGYPYGKARNEIVLGDNNGTPLEAKWVSDIWGFLQALLVAGGVAPSGVPDKAGASDYLEALQAGDHVWTGDNNFAEVVGTPGCTASGSGEYNYASPRTRKVMVPLRPTWNPYQASTTWIFSPDTLQWVGSDSIPFHLYFGTDTVPTGARIKAVRAACNASVGATLQFNVINYDTSGPNAGVAGTDHLDTISAGALAPHLMEILCDELVHNETQVFHVKISVDAAPGFGLRWVQVEFTDPGPRNY